MFGTRMNYAPLIIAVLLAACATPQMVVPQDVASISEEIKVTERSSWSGAMVDESFKLGSYSIMDVDRDWNSTKTSSIVGFSKETSTGGYTYVMDTGGAKANGQCAIEGKKKTMQLVGGWDMSKAVNKIGCHCAFGDAETNVVLESRDDSNFKGTLKTRSGEYQIEAIYERQGSISTGDPSGYRVDGEGPVAAAEVIKPGRIWLSKTLEATDREDLACIFSGLMLYLPSTKD